jgi:hypothetical protein
MSLIGIIHVPHISFSFISSSSRYFVKKITIFKFWDANFFCFLALYHNLFGPYILYSNGKTCITLLIPNASLKAYLDRYIKPYGRETDAHYYWPFYFLSCYQSSGLDTFSTYVRTKLLCGSKQKIRCSCCMQYSLISICSPINNKYVWDGFMFPHTRAVCKGCFYLTTPHMVGKENDISSHIRKNKRLRILCH